MEALRRDLSVAVRDAVFPPACGIYVVWPAEQVDEQPLYIGVAATQTIEQRWRRQHLRSRAGGSALRRSLGVELGLVEKKLSVRTDGRFYPPDIEQAISSFLLGCRIAFVVASSPEEARQVELEMIRELRPRLNVRR